MTKQTTLGLGTLTLGVIIALAALLLFASTALAAGSVDGDSQDIAVGGTATVTVSATFPSGGLGNWLVDASLDAADLTYGSCTAPIQGGGCNLVGGDVRFAGFANGLTSPQTLGTLTVTGTAAFTTGCSDITLTVTAFENDGGVALDPSSTDGEVCIQTVTNSPSPSPSPSVTAKTVPATGGPAGDSSSPTLSLLLGAAGLIVVAGGAWTVARARREEN